MKTRVLHTLTLLAALACVTGCTGPNTAAPTDNDVTHAIRTLVQQQSVTFGTPAASTGTATTASRARVTSVHNFGCNRAPDYRGYLCETRITIIRSPGGQHTLSRLVRLVKTASGWQATMQ